VSVKSANPLSQPESALGQKRTFWGLRPLQPVWFAQRDHVRSVRTQVCLPDRTNI